MLRCKEVRLIHNHILIIQCKSDLFKRVISIFKSSVSVHIHVTATLTLYWAATSKPWLSNVKLKCVTQLVQLFCSHTSDEKTFAMNLDPDHRFMLFNPVRPFCENRYHTGFLTQKTHSQCCSHLMKGNFAVTLTELFDTEIAYLE